MAQSCLLSPENAVRRFFGTVSKIIPVKSVESTAFKRLFLRLVRRLFLPYPGKLCFSGIRPCGAGACGRPRVMCGPPFRPANENAIHAPKLFVRDVHGVLFLIFRRTAFRCRQSVAVHGIVLLPVLQKE